MAHEIKLTRQADNDLDDIIEYTLRRWGAAQVERYLGQLDRTIEKLKEQPSRQGHSLEELKPGLRYVRHKDHYFIFFRVKGDRVEIVRILHQRRDWQRLVGAE